MNSLQGKYRIIVEQVLREYAEFLGNDDQVQIEQVFDRDNNRYILVEAGWHNGDRIYDTLLHIDIINGKLWIQQDKTEEGVLEELLDAGIAQDAIVLGFKPEEQRKLTEFAVS